MHDASFIRSRLLASHGITGIFSLRNGGVSPPPFDSQNFGPDLGDADKNITHNLHGLVKAARLPSIPHQAIQVHQTGLLWCNGQGKIHPQQADILISEQRDTAVAVRVADCLPILLADPKTGIVAAVHAGWRGTAAGIVKHAILAMRGHGVQPQNLLASLGPCIGPCCFAIGPDAASALQDSAAGAADFISHTSGAHADLSEINRLQLLEAGLSGNHIEASKACTVCESEHFFSFRRDGERSGRHIAVVAIPSRT